MSTSDVIFYSNFGANLTKCQLLNIDTYWPIPILWFAQILAIPIHPFIQYRIAQYGMRPY